jgi:hypothetical protein
MVYCESCGEEDLDYWIEMPDGSLVCSPKCGLDWMKVVKENREESAIMGGYKYTWTAKDTKEWMDTIYQKSTKKKKKNKRKRRR